MKDGNVKEIKVGNGCLHLLLIGKRLKQMSHPTNGVGDKISSKVEFKKIKIIVGHGNQTSAAHS